MDLIILGCGTAFRGDSVWNAKHHEVRGHEDATRFMSVRPSGSDASRLQAGHVIPCESRNPRSHLDPCLRRGDTRAASVIRVPDSLCRLRKTLYHTHYSKEC